MIVKLKTILTLTLAFVFSVVVLQWLVPLSLAVVLAAVMVFVWLERRLVLGGIEVLTDIDPGQNWNLHFSDGAR